MTNVTVEQFEWVGDRLIHKPTGARFHKNSAIVNYGRAGETLADGNCYEREDIYSVAHQLVLESHAKK